MIPEAVPQPLLGPRLSLMMFLQYAIWGAWLPLLQPFLTEHRKLSDDQVGWIGACGAMGALFAPFVAGQIADRYMATERFLALSHLLGAALVWQLSSLTDFTELLVFAFFYSLLYAPTMPLTNALAFHHLTDRDKQFGRVRLWGTIGWIAVGIGIGQWLLRRYTASGESATAADRATIVEGMADAFRLSALLGAAMGLYCLTLPHTPPQHGAKKFAPWEALEEIRVQPLITLFLLSIPVSILHQIFFYHAAGYLGRLDLKMPWIDAIFGVGGGGLMTIGQISEIFFLLLITFIAKGVPRKTLLAIGLLAYAARFAVFAFWPEPAAVLAALALHGPVFGCFIFLAFMIVDEETSADVRGSAQGLYNLVIVGFGVILGSKVAGWLATWSRIDGGAYDDGKLLGAAAGAAEGARVRGEIAYDYGKLFGVAAAGSIVCLLLLLAFYPSKRRGTLPAR